MVESLPVYGPNFAKRESKGIHQASFNQLVAINVCSGKAPYCTYGTFSVDSVARDGCQRVYNGLRMIAWRNDLLHQRYGSYCSKYYGFERGRGPGHPFHAGVVRRQDCRPSGVRGTRRRTCAQAQTTRR